MNSRQWELSQPLIAAIGKSVHTFGDGVFVQKLLLARVKPLGIRHQQLYELISNLQWSLVDSGEYYHEVQKLADQYTEYLETDDASGDDGDLTGQVVLDAIDGAYYAADEHQVPYIICEALIGEELSDEELLKLIQSLK